MAVQYADNSFWQIPEWTATGEPRVVLDPNGTEVTNTFDKLGRLTARSIEPGAGHGTTLAESFAYDGLSRLVRAQDADSRVERRFDSLGNLLQEVQSRLDGAGNVVGTPYTVGYEHDDRGNEWLLHYPHGRHVKRTFDDLGRIVRWDNTDAAGGPNGLIAQDTYAGAAARIEKRAFANGTETRFGYDVQRRMTESLTVRTATQAQIARVTSSWDPAGNKTDRQDWQDQTATPWQSFDFGRDSLYRLASVTGMQGGAALPAMDYALDPAGNRDAVTQGTLTTDYAFLTADNEAVNQYGRRAIPAAQMVEDLYWDAAGSLAAVEQFIGGQMGHVENWTYNWRHQPVTFQRWAGTSGLPAAQVTYRYDALGRRIARVENGTETRFVYDGGRVIEERRGTDDSVLASYVHGAYIDDVVTMRRAVPQGGIPADWFFHSDDQFSVSAVTNAAGALAERVAYGDFGASTFLSPGGTAMVASAIGNPYAFTGRRWDAAERTYHYRFRTFSPGLGRFTTRDPIGIWGDALNLGNGYTYTGNDPWSWVDPWGLCETDIADSSFAGIFRSVTNTINDAVDSVVGAAVSVVRPAAIGIHEIEEGLLGIQDKDSRSLEGIGMTTRNVISNLTWESPQAFAGLLNTSFVLTVGNLYQLKNGGDLATVDASQYASLSVIQIYGGSPPGYGGAITLPPFIWYESKEMSHLFLQEGYGGVVFGEKIPTDLHEAIGHGSQSKDLGPVYLPLGLHSLCLNALQLENNSYIEVDANRRVRRYMEGKKQ